MERLPSDLVFSYFRGTDLRKCAKEYFSVANQNRSVSTFRPGFNFVIREDFTVVTIVWLHLCCCSLIEYYPRRTFVHSVTVWLWWSLWNFIIAIMLSFCCCSSDYSHPKDDINLFLLSLSIVDTVQMLLGNRSLSGLTILQILVFSSFSVIVVTCFVVENVPLLRTLFLRRSLLSSHSHMSGGRRRRRMLLLL